MKEEIGSLSLKEYLENKPLEVKNYSVKYPASYKQQLLFGDDKRNYQTRKYNKISGSYYEVLTSAITGGIWRGTKNSSHSDWGFFPDVVTEDSIIDSKGVCWKEKCALLDFQIHRYLLQQCNRTFMPQEKIRYFIFKYRIRSPSEIFGNFREDELDEKIISTLSRETAFLIDLPFSVLYNLHNPKIPSSFKSRYDGDKWDNETAFLCKGLLKMLSSPEEVLRSVQLEPSQFDIIKTHLPEGMTINGFDITPYPILRIEDRNYEAWLKKLKEDNAERLVQLENERKTRDEYRNNSLSKKSNWGKEKSLFHSN
ncbi:Uncharacterised protein [uncultured archaeon]|nr:Uncharacterised protein [uncultured archaeon]